MTATKDISAKRESLTIRIKAEEKSLIDQAARVRGKSRTDFILDAARQAAQDAILDQTVIAVTPAAYEAFLARLEGPPRVNVRLRRTMRTRPPWQRK